MAGSTLRGAGSLEDCRERGGGGRGRGDGAMGRWQGDGAMHTCVVAMVVVAAEYMSSAPESTNRGIAPRFQ